VTNPLSPPPLEFTRYLQQMQDYVIGALSKPLPATDPVAAYRYNESRARTLQNAFRQRPLLRMQDKNLEQLAFIGGERSVRFEEIATDTGEAGVVIRGGSDLGDFVRNAVRIEEDLHLSIDVNPSRPSWKTRWGGKITTINVKRDSTGIHTVELIASAQREHLKHVLVGSTPFFAPEVQPLSMWMLPANCRTACATTLFINLMRQYEPGLSMVTNIMNPFGWLNPIGDGLMNFNPQQWPIQVQYVNAALDQSRTTVFTGAWNDFHTASLDVMRDAGVCARAYTVFTDDVDNPQPELAALLPDTPLNSIPIVGSVLTAVEAYLENKGVDELPDDLTIADLARPQRNCVMVAFEDHSGYGGPTGTAADGVINLFASTLDDLISTVVFPVTNGEVDGVVDPEAPVDPVFKQLFGVAPKPPWAIYRDGQYSGIIESNYIQHKGPVKTVMTGGKSPKLVNDLQTFGIKLALSQLQTVVTAGVFGEAGGPPIGAGLDELYQGQLRPSTTSFSRGNATPTHCAPSTPATRPTWSRSGAGTPHTQFRRYSHCGKRTGRRGRSGRSTHRSCSPSPSRFITTSCSMTGWGLSRTASSTSTRSTPSSMSTTGPSRSPSLCRWVMTPTTRIRSRRASKPCKVWAR
jgi:hypothetical protein